MLCAVAVLLAAQQNSTSVQVPAAMADVIGGITGLSSYRLTAPPHEVVTVGPRAARVARAIAIRGKLRGPDALNVWLARREGVPLCTRGREIVTRGARFCTVIPP